MAAIYDMDNGMQLTDGLQGCTVSDEAIQTAQRIAVDLDEPVLLEDDDGMWEVNPDGTCDPHERTPRYTCDGSVRGSCGVKHGSPEAAGNCTRRDHRGCVRQGGYSDRTLVSLDGLPISNEDFERFYDAFDGSV